jgi:hypothetical protein
MGTRSLTHIYDKPMGARVKPILTFYRQFDGYPSGHGAMISKTFKGRWLVNGYGDAKKQVNGMRNVGPMLIGAYYVGEQDGDKPMSCGNLYIEAPGAKDCGEEYVYHLYPSAGETVIRLRVDQGYHPKFKTIFDGPLDEFNPLMQQEEDA